MSPRGRPPRGGTLRAFALILVTGAAVLVAAGPAAAEPVVRSTPGQLVSVTCLSETFCAAVGRSTASAHPRLPAPGVGELRDADGWHAQQLRVPGDHSDTTYDDVACTSPTSCLAVGENLLADSPTPAARWDGTTWTRLAVPPAITRLGAVACPSPSNCVAVGTAAGDVAGAALWNGTRWTTAPVPSPAGATFTMLESVSCPTVRWCLAVGRTVSSTNVLTTTTALFDGTAWTAAPTPARPRGAQVSSLNRVDCRSPRFCMATGIVDRRPFAEMWDGTGWTRTTTPPRATGQDDVELLGVSCSRVTTCLAVGDAYDAHTGKVQPVVQIWDGATWTVAPSTAVGDYSLLNDVSCVRPTSCIAVGFTDFTTLVERWDGATWVQEPS